MTRNSLAYTLYTVTVTLLLLAAVEFACQKINYSRGIKLPFFVHSNISIGDYFDTAKDRRRFKNLDPHLGYARKPRDESDEDSHASLIRYQGFAVYSDEDLGNFDRPIILAMGGSTTDHFVSEISWPEQLASLLLENDLEGTVINGGHGGYSTNQELIKLMRDGLEFEPDLVISFSGVNDRGKYGSLPYPMVHSYQRRLLAQVTEARVSPVLPNAVYLLGSTGRSSKQEKAKYTLGMPTRRSLAEQFYRNHSLMKAISNASGAEYLGILQPNAYVGRNQHSEIYGVDGKPKGYVKSLRELYAEILAKQKTQNFVHSFIDIFDGIEGVYEPDGVHVIRKGDAVIAQEVLELILGKTNLFKPN